LTQALRVGRTICTVFADEDSDNDRNNRDRPSILAKFDTFSALDATVRRPRGVNRFPAGVVSRHVT